MDSLDLKDETFFRDLYIKETRKRRMGKKAEKEEARLIALAAKKQRGTSRRWKMADVPERR